MSKWGRQAGRMQNILYPTDLSDEQWNLLQAVLPPRPTRRRRGRPPAAYRRFRLRRRIAPRRQGHRRADQGSSGRLDEQGRVDLALTSGRHAGRRGCVPDSAGEIELMSALGELAGCRILFLNWRDLGNPAAGGAEVYTEQIARRFARAGS